MNWREGGRGRFSGESADGEIGYELIAKRNGEYYIKAYLIGGREHRLPFQNFLDAEAAMDWVAEYEFKRAEKRARYAQEEPIRI